MRGIEDDLRAVMAEHDDEAPGSAELLRALDGARASRWRWVTPRTAGWPTRRPAGGPSPRTAGWLVPLAAASAVAAIVIASVWAGGLVGGHGRPAVAASKAGTVAPMACPARYAAPAPWVPARPSRVDGHSRLVPRLAPGAAVICKYDVGLEASNPSPWPLTGRRILTSGLGWLAGQLSWQPRRIPGQPIFCTMMLGKRTNYLVGLAYASGGTLWVSATTDANDCTQTSNGQFTSSTNLGDLAARAFASGQWPARSPVTCARPGLTSRLGQAAAMVPAGSTSLTVCPAEVRLASGYGRLVSALNSLPTFTSTRGCSHRPGQRGPSYQLIFSYPQGPAVDVSLTSHCVPSIDNLGLQAASAATIVPIVRQLLGQR